MPKIEVVKGGHLDEISEENVEIKGKQHSEGGVDLNTGDEVRGDETMNTKKGMVFSASLINPETGNPFAVDHKKIVKEIKLVEERGPRKKLAILKEKEEELFEKQQKLNGNNGGEVLEDGGTVDPPTAADALKPKYYKVGEKEYTVRPNRLDAFLTEFPDAKEHDLVNGKLVLKTSPTVGQKKNISTETTKQPPVKLTTNIDLTKVNDPKADNPMGYVTPTLNLDEQKSVDFFKERKLKVQEKVKELQDGHYNDIVEFKIKENRDNLLTDPFKLFKDQHGDEEDDIIEAAARIDRDNDNELVASYIIPELKKREEGIIQHNMTMNPTSVAPRETVQDTELFKSNLDEILDGYKGIKIKRADGTFFDTDQVTPSQRDEIRKLVTNTYQAKNTFDSNVKYIQESVQQAVTGNLDNPMASFIKEAGIDKGIIPASEEQWKPYFDNLEVVSEKYAPIIANTGKQIEIDNAAYKESYQNEVAEFTNMVEPKALELKQGLETQVQNQELKPEEASAIWNEFKTQTNKKEADIFEYWNAKINENSQLKLKAIEDGMNQEISNAMKGTILENVPADKINDEYVKNSINSFMQLVGSETERELNDKSVWLKNQQQKVYSSKDYLEKFQVENIRGALQMAEGVGGYISFLGGFEAGNIVNDVTTQYNVDNPSYNAGHFEFNKLIDPDYWISVVGPMVGQQAIFLPISLTGAGLGAQVAGKLGLGAVGTQIAQGVGSAIATRPLNAMVNSGSYYNDLINSGMGTEEAGKLAANDFTFQMGIGVLDAIQMTFTFGKIGNPFKSTVTKLVGGAATEGGEEVLEGFPERSDPSQTFTQYATSDVGIDQFTGGAMGGMVMAGAFAAPDVASVFSKSEQKFTQGMLFDLMSQSGDITKRYEDLRLTLDTLKERKQITDKQYQNALGQLEFVYTKGREIPVNISDTQKKQILSDLGDINQLNQVKANTTDETLIKVYEGQIKDLEKKVQGTMAGTEPMYFIGKVPYSKEEFEQLAETPEVFDQIVNQTTTFNVINDDTVLNKTTDLIQKYEDSKNEKRIDVTNGSGETLKQGQLDLGTSTKKDAPINTSEDQSGISEEQDLEEVPFPEDEPYNPKDEDFSSNDIDYQKAVLSVQDYAKENNLEITEEDLDDISSHLVENPDISVQEAIDDITSPVLYETKNGRYHYIETEDGVKMLDSSGNEAKLSSKQKALYDNEYAENKRLSKEDEDILNKYQIELERNDEGSKDDAIAELLKSGLTEDNFNKSVDPNLLNKNPSTRTAYINEKALPLDVRIQEINEMYFNGQDVITELDVEDFIRRNPSGLGKRTKQQSEKAKSLEKEFKKRTGLSIDKILNRKPQTQEKKTATEETPLPDDAPELNDIDIFNELDGRTTPSGAMKTELARKYGREKVEKAIQINKDFDTIVAELITNDKIRKEC